MNARAQAIGGPAPGAAEPAQTTQYLGFEVCDGRFGMAIRHVREIIRFIQVTRLPVVPPFIRGVINLRGAVLPVIDLAARLGGRGAGIDMKSCVVVVSLQLGNERFELGLLVDSVSEVIELGEDAVEPAPEFGLGVRREFVRGVCRPDGKLVTLLDPATTLDVEEMAALCDACQADAFA